MGKIIACVNEKGGVAKTTTIKNVSIGLAMRGKKVLVIDLDPSANLTKALGLTADSETGSICEILEKSINFEEILEGFGIVHQEEGIDVITSSKELHVYESKLASAQMREIVLRRYVSSIREKYDYIFLDCPAGLGIFVTNALYCADSLIIPLQPQFLAVEAMQNLFGNIAIVRKLNGTNTKPEVLGALFTMVRTNTKNDMNIIQELRKNYSSGVPFFKTYIPLVAKIPESDLARKSIYRHAEKSNAAMIYNDLVDEILEKIEE